MSDNDSGDKHEKALDLTEQALDALEEGDEKKADRLLDQAKKLDKTAVEEVVKDMDEDAATRKSG